MYAGNGVTKRFKIPEGYDGSEVYLTFPGGKTIRMHECEGYEVSGDYVKFDAAIPAGIRISFEESADGEELNSKGYVVIYGDGSIKEVDEDPVKYLEETQRLLTEAEKQKGYERVC